MLKPFEDLNSRCVPLNLNNVDTDQVIPARFLKGTVKTGLGEKMFYDLRYNEDGSPKADFAVNKPEHQGAQILVSGHNFGCGSSREHAPWALRDFGFQAIIAVSFAEIFKNNAQKNFVLTIVLPEAVVLDLMKAVEADPALQVQVKLADQLVLIPGKPPQRFEIDPYRKTCLLEGLDDIGYTLSHANTITAFEAGHRDKLFA